MLDFCVLVLAAIYIFQKFLKIIKFSIILAFVFFLLFSSEDTPNIILPEMFKIVFEICLKYENMKYVVKYENPCVDRSDRSIRKENIWLSNHKTNQDLAMLVSAWDFF